jgi:uncharacterized damage-inducible protein DinB
MNVDDIQTLYAYNRWTNQRLFTALEKLNDQQLATEVHSSFTSILETVFHILLAEWLWLKRWQGASPRATVPDPNVTSATWKALSPGGIPTPRELTTLAELKSFGDSIERERQEFLSRLSDSTLHAPLNFKDMAGTPIPCRWYNCYSTWSITAPTIADRSPPCCDKLARKRLRSTCCTSSASRMRREREGSLPAIGVLRLRSAAASLRSG